MTIIGKIEQFKPEEESITAYLERVELYFAANNITEGEKKVTVFLSVVGVQPYTLLRDLVSPAKPKEKTFAQLTEVLKKHYEPTRIVIAERFYFHRRNQQPDESIVQYIAELRRLATHCQFAGYLDEALRDRFVCGIRSEAIQRSLLTETDLTLARAIELAQGMEAAEKNAQSFKGHSSDSPMQRVHAQRGAAANNPGRRQVPPMFDKPCHRCGKKNHSPADCRYKDAVCNNCHKKGHLAKVCRKLPQSAEKQKLNKKPGTKQRNNDTNWVQTDHESPNSDSDSDIPIYRIGAKSSHPITVDLEINNKKLTMEIDTGATVSIISNETRKKLFPEAILAKSSLLLRTYTGEVMPVAGEMNVDVKHGLQTANLTLTVVEGSGPSLFGRDWLGQLQLDWKTIGLARLSEQDTQIEALKKKYDKVFSPGLGTMLHFKARLHLQPGAKPVFFRPRSIPFAIKETVEKELDRLKAEGIIEKVDRSEWAAPIVPIPKGDGHLRICGDYRVAVNPLLVVDQHPLPKPEELFSSLSGGQKFSKIDLSHAYQQMVLEEDSRKYVVINTHKGLYRYTRLPFGIAPAPALFQRTMDTILQGIPNVLCYLDDILIAGSTQKEHLQNLEEVLKRLQYHGIRAKVQKCAFNKDSVEYLGHVIDKTGLHTSTKKVKAVQEAPLPKNRKQLKSFLGLIHYYGKFIPKLSTLVHPLNELLQENKRWQWSKHCGTAFAKAKQLLSEAPILAHFDPKLPLCLAGDASAYGVGTVLSHRYPNGEERPIAYASRTLSSSEKNYAQLEREALSLIFGVQKFHQFLYGCSFMLYTDHKPLTVIFNPKKGIPPLSAARLQRWSIILSAYDYTIAFKPTQLHGNADGLSRLPLLVNRETKELSEPSIFNVRQIENLPVTATQLRAATRQDSILAKVLMYIKQAQQKS